MAVQFDEKDRIRIKEGIIGRYSKAAQSPVGMFRFPTGLEGLSALRYESRLIEALPAAVRASYCGVGNPFSLGPVREGEAVLDVGSGAGTDALVAAMMVGTSGTVAGIELVPEMLAKAKEGLASTDLTNVTFSEASAEQLPFPDAHFDVVTSNGVLNLVVDKAKALQEVFRVLKPGGRLMVADQVLTGEMTEALPTRIENWAR